VRARRRVPAAVLLGMTAAAALTVSVSLWPDAMLAAIPRGAWFVPAVMALLSVLGASALTAARRLRTARRPAGRPWLLVALVAGAMAGLLAAAQTEWDARQSALLRAEIGRLSELHARSLALARAAAAIAQTRHPAVVSVAVRPD